MTQAPLLALPRLPGHYADILPVAKVLRNELQQEIVFLVVDTGLAKQIENGGFHVIDLSWRRSTAPSRNVDDLGDLRGRLERCLTLASKLESPISVEESEALLRSTRRVLRSQLSRVYQLADSLVELFEVLNPCGLVVGNPYTMEGRLAARIASGYDVASAAIEHGSIFPNDPIWEECAVDLVCAWGEPSRRALLSCGVPDSRIAVTGGPRFDEIVHTFPQRRAARDTNQDYLLVATSGPGDQVSKALHMGFIRTLRETIDATPEIRWTVKLHNKDRLENYALEGLTDHPRVRIVSSERNRAGADIFDYLCRARGMITISSTAALDAMLVNVPVIAVDVWHPGPGLKGVEFLERGCRHRVIDSCGLTAAAREVWCGVSDPTPEEAAVAYAEEHFQNRGEASRVVAKELLARVERTKS